MEMEKETEKEESKKTRGYMTVRELSREQLVQIKEQYMLKLSDEGCFNAVIYNRPEDDEDFGGVSMGELARADELVPDDIVFQAAEDTVFAEEDFFG